MGVEPVFADVLLEDHTIDPNSVSQKITEKTSGILGVHVWGAPCDTDALNKIADEHDLQVFYDAAHAFGCGHNGAKIGNFGRCEVFSFHATKFFNTFEGGAIATNDDDLAKSIRLTKNFGFASKDNVVCLGTNGKMSEVSAAMGLASMATLDRVLEKNFQNYNQYKSRLEPIKGIKLYSYDEKETNWQYVVLEVDSANCDSSRDEIVDHLAAKQIFARRYFFPGCHRMEPYASTLSSDVKNSFPITDRLCNSVICLPSGTAVSAQEIDFVCDSIVECTGR
jgi:dTDP-4-amino-4,6-dideoxygalactose transaminase